ncbi:Fc receptor-like protein 2 [Channa argus]|uniref:Fc receptor-like protein 2 n=1 Tax=Channa argus TaxID=215402 RepID=A0A6G1QR52_CHAAH|nr:Fc receptor-like protein 2 [Channa argus]KAK2884916.1 hypothetical protein Q8A73_021390 [Channa argus]
MRGGKHLLLLAVFVAVARCQQLKVSISPNFTHLGIFSGDLFYLKCEGGSGPVKWYFNNSKQSEINETLKITSAHPKHSGFYQCESNGKKSETLPIDVNAFLPQASLTIRTGQPVMQTGGSVILHLENEDGLQGWKCWVNRGLNQTNKIVLRLKNPNDISINFQTSRLLVPETIFWCTDSNLNNRSNQVTVRTSGRQVSLEMYPPAPIEGEKLSLKCLVWGTDDIKTAQFFHNDTEIAKSSSSELKFPEVKESLEGKYKCIAIFSYKSQTAALQHTVTSEEQYAYIHVPPVKAVLSQSQSGMSCSLNSLKFQANSYHWYYKSDATWTRVDYSPDQGNPTKSGTYACRGVFKNGRSSLSNSYKYESSTTSGTMLVVIVLVLLILGIVLGIVYIFRKRRNTRGPIYEDVALKSRDKGDDKYEPLQKAHGAQKEGEYDTLHPEAAGGEKKEGEYEPLKQEERKEGVYHTLGMEGAAGGEGGYEALKKEGMKEGVYSTLGTEGAAGGEGGYEALKKEGMKEGLYHTLGKEGAAGGEGGYEALKKEGMKEGVYQTLGTEGAAGGKEGHVEEGKGDKDKNYETMKENEEVKAD